MASTLLPKIPSNLCIHVPHSGTGIPIEFKEAFIVPPERVYEEISVMTDWYTDDLFLSSVFPSVVFPVSRIVCDVERFLDNNKEPMSKVGMGVYYTHGYDRSRIKHFPVNTQRNMLKLCTRLYKEHHNALRHIVDDLLWEYDDMVLIDAHSFMSVALPYEDETLYRPEICIGTDKIFTPKWLEELAVNHFKKEGLDVALNTPFSGTMVPSPYLERKDTRIHSIMIEVSKKLYMDEYTGDKSDGYYQLQSVIADLYDKLPINTELK